MNTTDTSTPTLIPPTPPTDPSSPSDLPRTIGFLGAIGLMVGIIIGSGIFKTPASISHHLDNPWTILALWGVGGLICLCGALTYAELATMFPQSGGIYVFLREGFGRPTAFVFGWTYMLISKPLAAAGIAIVFVEHINRLLPPDRYVEPRITTCVLLLLLTALNERGTQVSTRFNSILTAIKIVSLGAIVLLGAVFGHHAPTTGEELASESATPMSLLAALAPVMGAILWTYDGWSDVGAIAGEVKNPQRTLPRVFLVGTLLVTTLYIAVNAVFIWIVPLAEMRNFHDGSEASLAPTVMDRLIGSSGATIITIMVLISTLGSTHGAVLTGGRVTYAQARDGLLFRWLGAVHPRYQTPARSLWVQCILSCTATVALGTFEKLAAGFIFTMWIFYGLAGVSLFVLRVRQREVPRPYRCWGYPVVPGVFVLSALAMTVLTFRGLILADLTKRHLSLGDLSFWGWLAQEPVVWTGVLIAGFPVYYVWERVVRAAERKRIH